MTYKSIDKVLVVGAGWVGRQIAARFSLHGVHSFLSDSKSEVVADAIDWIKNVHAESASEYSNSSAYIAAPTVNELDETWAQGQDIDLVLECVPEQVSIKKRVLRKLSSVFPSPIIIASNSSYFVPSLLGNYVESSERFANIHFHVPVLKDSVVDIVGCQDTDAEVLDKLKELTLRVKHEPLMLRNEHPGYIFNWILQAVLKSSLELAALDVADPEDIDKSWKAVTGMPVGPFGIMDRIGLDVVEQVLANSKWSQVPEADVDAMRAILTKLVDEGQLGVKSGSGFYEYEDKPNDGIV